MSKRFAAIVTLCVIAATAAHAQYGGGGGGGGRGGRGGRTQTPPSNPTSTPTPAPAPAKPVSSIEIVGVIKAIDPNNSRVTIAYEDVEALNWPAGTMPFVVSKAELLKGATVGQKVRFKLDSQQISSLTPY
jgi:Cu/Ag efflux protein CusF